MLMENYVCHNIFYPLNNSFCPQDSSPPLKNSAPWQMNAFLIQGNTHILCLEPPLHNPIADQENKTFAPSSEVIAQEITCKDILFIFEKLIVLKRLPTPISKHLPNYTNKFADPPPSEYETQTSLLLHYILILTWFKFMHCLVVRLTGKVRRREILR